MPKILVIDDEDKLRSLLGQALSKHGFEVMVAPNGETGLKLARAYCPDLVVCDVHMDGLDGYEVLAELRKDSATATTPFILMTGQADLSGMRQGMTLGADDYLPKPFKIPDLLTVVENRLRKQQMLRDQADQQLASLRTQISMMMPHELLTPLTGILGASELIAQDATSLSTAQIAEFARIIHQSGTRLRRLIENFLIYAQIELLATDSAKVTLLRQSLTPSVETIVAGQAGEQAEAAGRSADLHVDLAPASVAVSEDHLRKILSELLDNAFKFSKPGTPVQVTVRSEGRELHLTIADRGRGIKPEYLANIGAYVQFERKFYEQQGSGLGLAIAKRLVEIYGGRFAAESEPNQGTCIRVILPMA